MTARPRNTPALCGFVAGVAVAAVALTGCTAGGPSSAGPSSAPAPSASAPGPAPSVTARSLTSAATNAAFAALEKRYGARIGLSVIDTGDGATLGYRDETGFGFASTSKALSAGLLLASASDADLDTVIHYGQSDLLDYAPVTSQHVATGMTLRDVIAAALQYSDNTAANLMTKQLGGPAAVHARLRSLGDATTNIDRTEPTLNEAAPGDPRDTTTPAALAADLRSFAAGSALSPDRRAMFDSLLRGNTTGGPYIRAGVPARWTVGDKTGNGGYGTRNDIGVVTPPHRSPLIVVILTNRGSNADATSDDALIADVTRRIVAAVS